MWTFAGRIGWWVGSLKVTCDFSRAFTSSPSAQSRCEEPSGAFPFLLAPWRERGREGERGERKRERGREGGEREREGGRERETEREKGERERRRSRRATE